MNMVRPREREFLRESERKEGICDYLAIGKSNEGGLKQESTAKDSKRVKTPHPHTTIPTRHAGAMSRSRAVLF